MNQLIPKAVSDLSTLSISQIHCGSFTTFAFYPGTANLQPPPLFGSAKSCLYCWGKIGSEKFLVPRRVESLQDKKIIQIHGGDPIIRIEDQECTKRWF